MAENTPTIIVKTNDQFVNNPKLEQVFSSIEKQLVAQTGFLSLCKATSLISLSLIETWLERLKVRSVERVLQTKMDLIL